MKQIKKLACLLLALVMILSMTVTAFADVATNKGEGSFKITLNGKEAGHTYSAYQIFTGDLLVKSDGSKVLSNIEWGSGVNSNGLVAALKANETLSKNPKFSALTDDAGAAAVAEALQGDDDSETARAFADVVGGFLSAAAGSSGQPTETTGAGGKVYAYTISPLAAGYYLVKDTGSLSGTDDAYTRYIMEVVADVTANVKAEIPEIEKKILEGSSKVDANNAGVGQKVSYEITGQVPNYTGYKKYFYVINDTLSDGLTFDNNVTVKVGSEALTANTDYYLYTKDTDPAADSPYTFQIAFNNIMEYEIGAVITVQYSATVNENAVVGETGNPNKVTLSYSNNPNSTEYNDDDSKPGIPDSKVPTGKTPEDITITYVAKVEITKKIGAENGEPLSGAEFTLTGVSKQTVLSGTEYYEKDSQGDYWLLKNGTYTQDAPQAEVKDPEGNVTVESNEHLYASTTEKYAKKTATVVTETDVPVVMTATSDTDGKLSFGGLGEGTYTIEETVVPAGYNKAPNMTVVIECEEPQSVVDGTEKAEWAVGNGSSEGVRLQGTTVTAGIYEMIIVNKAGSTLPSTGGIGTTIFYAAGIILMAGAVFFVIRKKRA